MTTDIVRYEVRADADPNNPTTDRGRLLRTFNTRREAVAYANGHSNPTVFVATVRSAN
jgi:hypothetical protein